ncbi:GtrA family protein [Cupriavidus agavae]|uniref:Putative flippase GtrA n=1 Tax=Cupriavidus agavae TaxID=1001822 RepID=A0A4Q7S772_9BURK|nr:GtrA family protein [Cupriavidus agavae]RZT41540.1 putative flippase GtrA [Cupriavidus agavae]
MKRFTESAAVRFLLSGGINTVATYAIYLVLVQFLQYQIAYTVTYLIGIALGYALNAFWVFRSGPNVKSAIGYPIVYLGQYGLGIGLLWVFVDLLHIDQRIAPALVIVITLPIMFMLSRLVFRKTAP